MATMRQVVFTPIMGETMHTTTRKTLYSKFMPSRFEEEEREERQQRNRVAQTLVEIRDIYKTPSLDLPVDPWEIKKVLAVSEAGTGCFVIAYKDAFEHVFRYWSMDMVEQVVVVGKRLGVVMKDVTDKDNPSSIEGFFEQGFGGEFYFLGCSELSRAGKLKPGDEVGIFWDIDTNTFQFKVLRRAIY